MATLDVEAEQLREPGLHDKLRPLAASLTQDQTGLLPPAFLTALQQPRRSAADDEVSQHSSVSESTKRRADAPTSEVFLGKFLTNNPPDYTNMDEGDRKIAEAAIKAAEEHTKRQKATA